MTIRPIIRADRNSSDALRQLYELSQKNGDIPIDISFDSTDPGDLAEKAVQALENYRNRLREIDAEHDARMEDTTRSVAALYQSLFRGGTRALWDDFKNIGFQVIAEVMAKFTIAKLAGKSFNLGGAVSSSLKGAGFGGFFANGGRPPVGKVSVVGERGPELFLPNVSGTIIPNHAMGGGGVTLVNNINAPGATAETVMMIRRELASAAPLLIQAAQRSTIGTMQRQRL